MKTLILSAIRLTWITFKSGLWLPVVPLYVIQHMGMLHIPAAAALLMML